mmetsp:Transcript_11107/g.31192  ORF Transcript_11107/g.31192 Transcript_11107/m.31192 type:complete len:252 (+) Transcript_11107:1351-2106(+)
MEESTSAPVMRATRRITCGLMFTASVIFFSSRNCCARPATAFSQITTSGLSDASLCTSMRRYWYSCFRSMSNDWRRGSVRLSASMPEAKRRTRGLAMDVRMSLWTTFLVKATPSTNTESPTSPPGIIFTRTYSRMSLASPSSSALTATTSTTRCDRSIATSHQLASRFATSTSCPSMRRRWARFAAAQESSAGCSLTGGGRRSPSSSTSQRVPRRLKLCRRGSPAVMPKRFCDAPRIRPTSVSLYRLSRWL